MVDVIYKILNICLSPFRMIQFNIIVVPFSMLIALLTILIVIKIIRGTYK